MTKKSNFKNRLLIPLILAILLTVLAVQPACAQDAGSLIGEVNALRASYAALLLTVRCRAGAGTKRLSGFDQSNA